METLSDELWDLVIAGTSIPQSLLALSLSRSGKKILHVDRRSYYGGDDAGLSLQDAENWVQELRNSTSTVYKDASIIKAAVETSPSATSLGPSRAYTLSLNPQIIYAKSEFLPTLVSSRIHTQLEFLAVGSWWVLRNGHLHKIPSTREDVFNDESLSMKDKRGLMKFLRYVLQEEEEGASSLEEDDTGISLKAAISNKFKIPVSLQSPLLALALSPVNADSMPFNKALARIRRHLRSMGYFGQGFGAVIPKYGGSSEISQVACRAQAVGGGVYLLGYGVQSLETPLQNEEDATPVQICLSDGTRVRSRYVAGSLDDIPSITDSSTNQQLSSTTWRSINVVANPLSSLFPPTSENGPSPAVAIVLIEDGLSNNPIYLQVHSEDTGECPAGQCIVYASTVSEDDSAESRLEAAVSAFLETAHAKDAVLWSVSYRKSEPAVEATPRPPALQKSSPQVLVFAAREHDIAFDDSVLEAVRKAWECVLGEATAAESSFLRFEEREVEVED
ncbi:hypothetical protein G647_05196 [Cladophialophora carrionii CBS 160.54]|uniref:Rab proteins geranylgeranyltransferase n=1 Tax=Cladophialophora carrionii CBS 160.54 TaxID=1279043 RepID=V9D994_9EURO|nr:uncharacterized protein G647_05196 [Cladophialophora carrionii CBS 160.54]ETI23395.1 hypothetical protein G647_05196 [Cladophialophora carrionii CBS 160.54]